MYWTAALPRATYFELALTSALVGKSEELGSDVIKELCTRLRLTRRQAEDLLQTAAATGLVERAANDWRSTPAGRALGASFNDFSDKARDRGRTRFRPFTDYTPERW